MTHLSRTACSIALVWHGFTVLGCGGDSVGGGAEVAGMGARSGAGHAGADGEAGAAAKADLTWALACEQPMFGLLQGEAGPPFTRTALGVSAPGVCEMSTQPQGTTLLDFRETNERSRVTLLAEGWKLEETSPESGITVTTDVPSTADGFLDNTDYTLIFTGPAGATIGMQYRAGLGQVSIALSSPSR